MEISNIAQEKLKKKIQEKQINQAREEEIELLLLNRICPHCGGDIIKYIKDEGNFWDKVFLNETKFVFYECSKCEVIKKDLIPKYLAEI